MPLPSSIGRWLAAASSRAGLTVLALTVPFTVWVFTSVGTDDTEAAQATPGTDSDPTSLLWWAPLLVLVVFADLLWRHRTTASEPSDPSAPRRFRRVAVVLACAAVGVCLVALPFNAFPWTAGPPQDFTPSVRASGLWMVAVLTAVGAALFLGTLVTAARHPSHTLAGVPAGALAVLAAALLIEPLAAYRPIVHSETGRAEGEAPPVPNEVTRVGWTWQPPEHTAVQQVRAGVRGPVIVLDDGLVALDGTTGQELWTYRAPYSPLEGAAVFDDGAEQAHVTFEPQIEGQPMHRVVLDTITGQILDQGPFSQKPPPSFVRPYQTPDTYLHAHEGVLTATTPAGEAKWRRALGHYDPDRACLMDTGSVRFHQGQVFVGELCADRDPDQEPAWADLEWGERHEEALQGGTASVFALDMDTGRENWRREWRIRPQESPPILFWGGQPRPGATPVILTDERVLDAETGQDRLPDLPVDLLNIDPYGIVDEDAFLHADSEGATLVERGHPDDPIVLHHADATGEVVDTTTLENSDAGWRLSEGIALEEALVAAEVTSTSGRGVPTVLVGGRGEDVQRIALEGPRLDGDRNDWYSTPHLLVPVPGAVVSYLDLGDDPEGTELGTVSGLVP
jgi:hypothetical protein